jgi:uncharacterized protein involved in exopolysaccharide biosynthesis
VNQKPLTIIDLFRVLYRRRYLLLGILFVIVSTGMVVTFLLPPTYQSTMKILVSRDRVDPQVTPTEKSADIWRSEFSEEEFNSEIEILRSRAVIEGVVKQLGLDRLTPSWLARLKDRLANFYRSIHQQTAPSATERAVTRLSERLEVFSIKKSRIIMVTYRESNPELAAQVLNELYRQYSEHHLHLRQNSKASNVFHEQSASFGQKLNEATDALKRFDAENSAAANTAQRDLLSKQFYEVQGDLDKARTEIRETEQRIATLITQLKAQPERIESEAHTKYVAARDKMKDEILGLELQRTQLLQKYQPNHRLVKDVEERLAQARELLRREEQSPPQERTTVLNDVHRRLTNELLTAQANLSTLRKREQSLSGLADQYRGQITRFDVKSLERADLERARAVNEEAYLLYRKKAQESDIVDALNLERIVNFTLAEPPSVNHRPVSPKPLINFAVLMVVGLLAAVTIVAFVERNRLLPGESKILPAVHADSLALAEGDRALALKRANILLTGEQSRRNGLQLPSGGENGMPSSDQALQAPDSFGSGSAAAENGVRGKRVTRPFPTEPDPSDVQPGEEMARRELARNGLVGEGLVGGKPEAWRVEAVVDYLHCVYRLPSEALSEVLRETVGWMISPEEINGILSRAASRQQRNEAVRSINS